MPGLREWQGAVGGVERTRGDGRPRVVEGGRTMRRRRRRKRTRTAIPVVLRLMKSVLLTLDRMRICLLCRAFRLRPVAQGQMQLWPVIAIRRSGMQRCRCRRRCRMPRRRCRNGTAVSAMAIRLAPPYVTARVSKDVAAGFWLRRCAVRRRLERERRCSSRRGTRCPAAIGHRNGVPRRGFNQLRFGARRRGRRHGRPTRAAATHHIADCRGRAIVSSGNT